VFADFAASFEDPRLAGKTFVRGNTINPETKGIIIVLENFKYGINWQLKSFYEMVNFCSRFVVSHTYLYIF